MKMLAVLLVAISAGSFVCNAQTNNNQSTASRLHQLVDQYQYISLRAMQEQLGNKKSDNTQYFAKMPGGVITNFFKEEISSIYIYKPHYKDHGLGISFNFKDGSNFIIKDETYTNMEYIKNLVGQGDSVNLENAEVMKLVENLIARCVVSGTSSWGEDARSFSHQSRCF